MTVSELILKIDEILNLDVASRLDVSSQTVEQAMEKDACCKTLLTCCNFMSDELYSDYALDCRTTVVQAANGLIDTSGLNIGKAVLLVDSLGNNVPFRQTSNGLTVKTDGKYNLTYARLPSELSFSSVVQLPNSKITERIFIYGVITEYLRITGDYFQSESYKAKFNQALSSAFAAKTTARMPVRRWLS